MLVLSRSYLKISKILALTNCHTAHQVCELLLFLLSALAKNSYACVAFVYSY